MQNNYDQIPEELRWDRNWCLAGPDEDGRMKAPYSFGPRGIFKIKPTDPTHWKDLETIIEAAQMFRPCGLGYILSTKDEYTVIDLDVKNQHNEPDQSKWTSEQDIARYKKIIDKFDSYTERSTSGQGWHIWVKGDIGAGCKRDGVEVYSRERFIICTGDVYKNKDIEYRQDLLDILVSEIRSKSAAKVELTEIEETETDEVILERARNAENSDKFIALFNSTSDSRPKAYDGSYTALGYGTQSEADLALLSMFTFYTKSNAQARRLFRMSGLGQRKKATKDDRYLNFTLALIRGREAVEDEADAAAAESGRRIVEQLLANQAPAQTVIQAMEEEDDFDYPPGMRVLDFNLGTPARTDQYEALEPPPVDSGLPWPPGMAGQLAYYMYQGSVRPIKEVSIVATLGLLAGMCGKAFNIPQSGLNIYVVLIAKSAIGKEAMHGGIANMLAYMRDSTPNSMNFVDFVEYASGPALSKAVAGNPSFVNVSGEWGR
ncbi:MAG: phage NrS-1 polymerase family protein, partial [Verrucomicrobiota bacterium]